jgi:capsular polysaccharide transport system permease protein
LSTHTPTLARDDKRKTVAALAPRNLRWPSREQWFRDAGEFSQRLRAKPPGLRSFGLVSFILIVVLPTLAAIFYFGLLASDQYFAEARFAVRSLRDRSLASDITAPKLDRNAGNSIGQGEDGNAAGSLSGGGVSLGDSSSQGSSGGLMSTAKSMFANSTDERAVDMDAYVLSDFIESRNMVADLDNKNALRTIYSRPEADWISRLDPSATDTVLWKYWRSKVAPSIDSISGVVTLRVLAFRPEDALAIATDVIRISRRVVNDYSKRIQDDAVSNAKKTLDDAAKRYEEALVALRDQRNLDVAVNPVDATSEKLKALVALETARAQSERDQWVSARLTSPDSMATQFLNDRIASLTSQINNLQSELTDQNNNTRTESAAIGQYRDLELTRTFAERSYAIAQAAFERARFEAQYKAITLAVFLPPRKPEMALYPRRTVNILLVFAVAMIVWALVRLVATGIAEYVMLKG